MRYKTVNTGSYNLPLSFSSRTSLGYTNIFGSIFIFFLQIYICKQLLTVLVKHFALNERLFFENSDVSECVPSSW